MRKTFTPDEVRAFTQEEMSGLLRKYVVVEVAARPEYKEATGRDYEGGTGFCIRSEVLTIDGERFFEVEFDYGMGWNWPCDLEAYVSVCDEHRGHHVRYDSDLGKYIDGRDYGAAACLSTLGVRGSESSRKEVDSGEEESKATPIEQI